MSRPAVGQPRNRAVAFGNFRFRAGQANNNVLCRAGTIYPHRIDTNSANTKGSIMKELPIVSVLIVGLIFATVAYFFTFSASFKVPVASKAGHHNQVVGRLAKYI
jgi:hypothetical protein